MLRLLARDGFGVAEVLDRLNKPMARDAADSVAAVAAAVAAAGAGAEAPVEIRDEGEQTRFLSLLYGEIVPVPQRLRRCPLHPRHRRPSAAAGPGR